MTESLSKNPDEPMSFEDENLITNNKRAGLPRIAAILLILAGFLSIIMWLSIATLDISIVETLIDAQYDSMSITAESLKDVFVVCGALGFLFGVFIILGGFMVLKRQVWGIGIAASVVGLFSIGPMFLSSIMCFLALIFLIYSKNEFYNLKQ
jgi:hypothetical protein